MVREPGSPQEGDASSPQRRLLRMLRCFYRLMNEPESVTIEELVKLLAVSRRTVLRDLALLRKAGVPVTFDRATRHYRVEEQRLCSRETLLLTFEESAALLEAVRSSQSDDNDRAEALNRAVEKLAVLVRSTAPSSRRHIRRMPRVSLASECGSPRG